MNDANKIPAGLTFEAFRKCEQLPQEWRSCGDLSSAGWDGWFSYVLAGKARPNPTYVGSK